MRKSNEEKNEKKVSTRSARKSKQVNTQPITDNITQSEKSQENFDYMYGIEAEQYSFYRMPKLLLTHDKFKVLSDGAKILYGLLLDRTDLSCKNGWLDEYNRVYIIFTQEETMEYLNCGNQKASKLMKELVEIGLIEIKRQGLNKANLIYVKSFFSALNTQKNELNTNRQGLNTDKKRKCENHTSRNVKITFQEMWKSHGINTDSIQTDSNKSLVKSSLSSKKEEKQKEDQIKQDKTGQDKTDPAATLKAYEQTLKENIEFNNLCNTHPHDKAFIEELLSIMLDVVMSENKTITVASEKKNKELVKSVFLKLNYYNLDSVIQKYKNITTKITRKRQYIITMLYNSYLESEAGVLNDVAAEEP